MPKRKPIAEMTADELRDEIVRIAEEAKNPKKKREQTDA